MKILAVEFSSARRSVAVVTGRDFNSALVLGTAVEAGGRHTHTIALVEKALRLANLEREEIECIAVGLGPGSYTGIRMAIAFAQGWELARPVRLLGISSIECLAAGAYVSGLFKNVSIVVDAQRNEVYLARYSINAAGWKQLHPLRLAKPSDANPTDGASLVLGPQVQQWFPSGTPLFPEAAVLGRVACSREDFVAGEKLEPIYLRETSFVKAPPPRVIL